MIQMQGITGCAAVVQNTMTLVNMYIYIFYIINGTQEGKEKYQYLKMENV